MGYSQIGDREVGEGQIWVQQMRDGQKETEKGRQTNKKFTKGNLYKSETRKLDTDTLELQVGY